uniref:Odorant binding protein n=1 Tax=Lissorhoptrus oryzophilus TaxID=308863 RepID=A0A0B4KZC3_9CUCU|nr:odorant binding protein [Lissorhoptrus oryzophilus]
MSAIMKGLFVFINIFLVANALSQSLIDELKRTTQEIGLACAQSEKATDADIELLMGHNSPTSHAGKCTVACVMKKMNILTPDGKFGEGYTEWLDKAKADDPDFYNTLENMYKECEKKVTIHDDHCETALEIAACGKQKPVRLELRTCLIKVIIN